MTNIDYSTFHKIIKNKKGKNIKLVLNHIENNNRKAYICKAKERKKYRWAITDEHGWDLNTKELRKVKLDKLNQTNVNSKYLLHVSLLKNGEFVVTTLYFSYVDMILKINGNKFKCKDLEFAETLITSLCDSEQYEIFPKYKL